MSDIELAVTRTKALESLLEQALGRDGQGAAREGVERAGRSSRRRS